MGGAGGAEATRSLDPPAVPAARPGLTLVATPIGNLGDLSPRALAALKDADAVLCEDSRVTGGLLSSSTNPRSGCWTRGIPEAVTLSTTA